MSWATRTRRSGYAGTPNRGSKSGAVVTGIMVARRIDMPWHAAGPANDSARILMGERKDRHRVRGRDEVASLVTAKILVFLIVR
jgi:hypothetical protein